MKIKKITPLIIVSAIILSFSGLTGCTSQEEKERAKQIEKIRSDVEKIKQQNKSIDKSLDSLNSESKRKDDELLKLQRELDSLNKIIEGGKK